MLQVLFRLNLLTVTLCLCMNRPYQFYHFVPLVSFWFLVVYILAWLPPRVHSGSLAEHGPRALLYLALKLLGLVSVITILYMSEVIITLKLLFYYQFDTIKLFVFSCITIQTKLVGFHFCCYFQT